MQDRALIPAQHVIRIVRAMLCGDCQVIFDGSLWFGCPCCASEAGVMAHPLAAKRIEDKHEGGASTPPSFSVSN